MCRSHLQSIGACPGYHVAERQEPLFAFMSYQPNLFCRSLAINTLQLLWAFNVIEDPSQPINTFGFTDAIISHPLSFKANFVPRMQNLRQIIEAD